MASNRWDLGKPENGGSYDSGFITAWDERTWAEMETMFIPPMNGKPATMAEQMDGDQAVTGQAGGRKRR